MSEFFESSGLLLVLLNPFLLLVYLIDVVQKLEIRRFFQVMARASAIAVAVFVAFALLGEMLFLRVIRAEFGSFQIFGGLVFLLIGLQFVFRGPRALEILRGESEYLAGAIAMPVLIGPGTISASVIIGKRLAPLPAVGAIALAVIVTAAITLGLKRIHDYVVPRHERLVERYIEIAGRITALFIGTVAVDMIARGARSLARTFAL